MPSQSVVGDPDRVFSESSDDEELFHDTDEFVQAKNDIKKKIQIMFESIPAAEG